MGFFDLTGQGFLDPNQSTGYNMPLLGLLQGLGAASAPSRLPVSSGQVWGDVAQGLMQGQQQAQQQQTSQMENQQRAMALAMLKGKYKMFGYDPTTGKDTFATDAASAAPAASAAATESQKPSPLGPTPPGVANIPPGTVGTAAATTPADTGAVTPTDTTTPTTTGALADTQKEQQQTAGAATAGVPGAAPAPAPAAAPGFYTGLAPYKPTPTPAGGKAADIDQLIDQSAQQYGLPPAYFRRQLIAESGLRTNARSPAGAGGIAQFMPATAAQFNIDPYNWKQAIPAAAQYMRQILDTPGIDGNYAKALAGYNWGPERAARNDLANAPRETQQYVAKILGNKVDDIQTPTPADTTGGGQQAMTTDENGNQVPVSGWNLSGIQKPDMSSLPNYIKSLPAAARQAYAMMDDPWTPLIKNMMQPRPMDPETQATFLKNNRGANPNSLWGIDPMNGTPVEMIASKAESPLQLSQDIAKIGAEQTARLQAQAAMYGGTHAQPDPKSPSLIGQTGLSVAALNYLDGGPPPRSQGGQAAVYNEIDAWSRATGTDTALIRPRATAINDVIKSVSDRNNQTSILEDELRSTIGQLKPLADRASKDPLVAANLARLWAGEQYNDPFVSQYETRLHFLQSELAGMEAVAGGSLYSNGGPNVRPVDEVAAAQDIRKGVNSGVLDGLSQTVASLAEKNKVVLGAAIDRATKQKWDLYGVGQNYKNKYAPVDTSGSAPSTSSAQTPPPSPAAQAAAQAWQAKLKMQGVTIMQTGNGGKTVWGKDSSGKTHVYDIQRGVIQ